MKMAEKVRILLIKCGNISMAELARRLKRTPQSFSNSMKLDNFTQSDLEEIAEALGVKYESNFIIPETNEKI